MRELKKDGIYTNDDDGLLLDEDGYGPEAIADDSFGKLDFSGEEEDEY